MVVLAHLDECSILKVPDVCSIPSEAFGFFRVYQCPVNTGGGRLYAVLVADDPWRHGWAEAWRGCQRGNREYSPHNSIIMLQYIKRINSWTSAKKVRIYLYFYIPPIIFNWVRGINLFGPVTIPVTGPHPVYT